MQNEAQDSFVSGRFLSSLKLLAMQSFQLPQGKERTSTARLITVYSNSGPITMQFPVLAYKELG
jgi:hypothetical protein